MADQAEINQADPPVVADEDVAGVRVGMKEALLQNHGKQGVGNTPCQHGAGFRRHPVDIGMAQEGAADIFLHQNLAVGILGIDLGNVDERMAGKGIGETLHIAQFERQIGFPGQAAGKILNHLNRPVAAGFGDFRFDEGCQMVQNTQIRAYAFFDVRPLDFNRHPFAVAQNRAVHLCDGRAADRFAVQAGEYLVHRPAEPCLNQRADVFRGNRRDVALQLFEFLYPLGIENVHPRGQNLPQLDKRRPQFLESQAETARRRDVAAVRIGGFRRRFARQFDTLHKLAQAVFGQNGNDFAQPRKIAHSE